MALAALFIVLQAYAELTYASFLLIFLALAVVWRVGGILFNAKAQKHDPSSDGIAPLRPRAFALKWRAIFQLSLRVALLAALFLAGIAPILANMLPDLRAEGDFFTSGGGFADIFSADLAGYLVPTQLHPILGEIVKTWSHAAAQSGAHFAVDKGQQIYMGYVALALTLLGLWRGRRRSETWFWAIAAMFFFLLTLGPNLRIAGRDTGIPLPFRVMEVLPFFKGNRYPSRYGVMLLLSLGPLVAAGLWQIAYGLWPMANGGRCDTRRRGAGAFAPRSTLSALRAFAVPCLAIVLLLFEHISAPLPLSDLRVPAIYARVAAESGDFALLELPPGWRNGARVAGKQDVIIMTQLWNQTAHGKRVLGGNTSRNPEFKFQYFSEDPTLARLIAQTNAADLPQHDALRVGLAASPITDQERIQARDWAAFLKLRYVMVHRDKMPPQTEALLRELLPVRLAGEEGSLALYRLDDLAAPQRVFALGTDAGRKALAEGWSPPAPGAGALSAQADPGGHAPEVYAQRREVRLLLPLAAQGGEIRLRGRSFASDQQVTLVVDGRSVGIRPLPETPTTLKFAYPAAEGRPPLSDVRLRFSRLAAAAEWTARMSDFPPALLVRSAGQETGDFGHIYVMGVEHSLNRRGYNLVALRPDGSLLDRANFDTHLDPTAGGRLAAWVAALSEGVWVAGAARDESSMNLGQDAADALRTLGVTGDLRGHFRWGHAFIGRKGASSGTALEMMDAVRPAQVSRGLAISAPTLAAAVSEIEIK